MASLPDSWGETPILTPLRLPENDSQALPESTPAPCPLCHVEFLVEDEDQKQELLRHLLAEHKFVIAEVHLISSLPAYLAYWRRKFDSNNVEAFCTKMRATVAGEEQEFTFLSDVLPEDKELRRRLQEEKLEQVLAVQEFERNQTNFQRGCLFCRQEFNRAKDLFNHMAFDHNFSVGQPDNLVFVSRFLDMIEEKLEALLCLHCEKVFKSREVLKEHMRKKQHKQLNPRNRVWNQFYLVNYLEFGRSWEDGARDEEEVSGWDPGEQGDAEWAEWRGEHGDMVCLYCPAAYPMTCDLLNHMKVIHGFDFVGHRTELGLNFYQQVKLVNYIRRMVHLGCCTGCSERFTSQEALVEHLAWAGHHTPSQCDWDQPQYFFPTYENDNLLFGLEDPEAGEVIEVTPEEVKNDLGESILAKEEVRKELTGVRRGGNRRGRGGPRQ